MVECRGVPSCRRPERSEGATREPRGTLLRVVTVATHLTVQNVCTKKMKHEDFFCDGLLACKGGGRLVRRESSLA